MTLWKTRYDLFKNDEIHIANATCEEICGILDIKAGNVDTYAKENALVRGCYRIYFHDDENIIRMKFDKKFGQPSLYDKWKGVHLNGVKRVMQTERA